MNEVVFIITMILIWFTIVTIVNTFTQRLMRKGGVKAGNKSANIIQVEAFRLRGGHLAIVDNTATQGVTMRIASKTQDGELFFYPSRFESLNGEQVILFADMHSLLSSSSFPPPAPTGEMNIALIVDYDTEPERDDIGLL